MKKARKNTIQRVHRPIEQKKGLYRNSAQYFVAVSLKRIGQILSKEERRKEVSDFFRQWRQLPKSVQSTYKKKWKQHVLNEMLKVMTNLNQAEEY